MQIPHSRGKAWETSSFATVGIGLTPYTHKERTDLFAFSRIFAVNVQTLIQSTPTSVSRVNIESWTNFSNYVQQTTHRP